MAGARPHATLVVLRHGESEGNARGTFAGWRDVPLTARGREQAIAAAAAVAALAPHLDAVFTSALARAVATADLLLPLLPGTIAGAERQVRWRLNERHCGALQGRDKDACKREFGREVIRALRSEWHARPPLAAAGGPDDPRLDARYRAADADAVADADADAGLPLGESFADVAARIAPVWRDDLAPRLRAGQNVLVVGHGMSLRVLLCQLEGTPAATLPPWILGNARPRCYRLDRELRVLELASSGEDAGSSDE